MMAGRLMQGLPLLPARSAVHCLTCTPRRRPGRQQPCRSVAELADQPLETEQQQQQQQQEEALANSLPGVKARLQQRTRESALLLAAYLCLAASPQAAVCCACGSAGSMVYLSLLSREVERLPADYQSSMLAAKQNDSWLLRKLSMWALSYQHALKPRMLIPVGLVLAFYGYNHLVDRSQRLGYIEIASLVLGFLAFKGALIREVWDSTQRPMMQGEPLPELGLYAGDLEQPLQPLQHPEHLPEH